MMYKIINKNTGDEFICDKVTIEGFDYYHTLEKGINSDNGFFIFKSNNQMITSLVTSNVRVKTIGAYYKVIATTNPNIECNLIIGLDSTAIHEAEMFVKNSDDFEAEGYSEYQNGVFNGFISGFNKAKETYQFTKEDMIEFTIWCENQYFYSNIYKKWSTDFKIYDGEIYSTEELLVIWNDQRTKTLYIQ